MKHDLSNSNPPFYTSQANSPTTFIYFYLNQPFDIDEINYLHFISVIGIIGNQWRTQTQLNNGAPHHCLWTPTTL